MAGRSKSGAGNGAGERVKKRRIPESKQFGAVDALFGDMISVERSLYFTMAAKTFYIQGEETTVTTTEIGSVRLDLESGEVLATPNIRPVVAGGLSLDAQEQGEAQLEVFRKGIERLFNKRRGGGIAATRRKQRGGMVRNPYGRNGKPKVAVEGEGAAFTASEIRPEEDGGLDFGSAGTFEEFKQVEAEKDARLKAKRERDATLKRERRAQARATKDERPAADGTIDFTALSDAELAEFAKTLDGGPEDDPDLDADTRAAQEYDRREAAGELTDDEQEELPMTHAFHMADGTSEYVTEGSEGPVEEGALG